MIEQVILVYKNNHKKGIEEKFKAHEEGLLHRAFSIIVYNEQGQILMQRRARKKYHSGGLLADTCSGHPRPGEKTKAAAQKRLKEETGLECKLDFLYKFYYKSEFDNGLTEHEIDYVYTGITREKPKENKKEIKEYNWMYPREIKQDMKINPDDYAHWFKMIIGKMYA